MSKKSKRKNNLPYCASCHRKALCHHLKAMPSRLTDRVKAHLMQLSYDTPLSLPTNVSGPLVAHDLVEKDPTSNRYRPTETGEWLKEYMSKGEKKMSTTKKRQTAMTEAFKQNYGRTIDKAIDKAQKEWCSICRHRNCHHKRNPVELPVKVKDVKKSWPWRSPGRVAVAELINEALTPAPHFAPITVRVPWKPIELRNVPFLEGR